MRQLRFPALLLAALVGRALQAQAVGDIRGRVVDQSTGRAIENADVDVEPGEHRVTTLDDGAFAIVSILRGVYVLSVRRVGYEPIDVNVQVGDSATTYTIKLIPIAAQLEAIRIREKSAGIQYSGVVLDQFDVPVADAEVVAVGINSQLKTDDLGRFAVPKLGKGTLTLRIRKLGYAAYFNSFHILAERADTIRMSRLAGSLPPVEVNERSGFGSDYWAYRELEQRQSWKGAMAGAISKEELAQHGPETLCDALPGTATGATLSLHRDPFCGIYPDGAVTILIDGARCVRDVLSNYHADDVELVEFYPSNQPMGNFKTPKGLRPPTRTAASAVDMSGSLAARRCDRPPPVYVIWLRHDAEKPTHVVADSTKPRIDTAATGLRLPPVKVVAGPLINAAHLQGQVVDSSNHPIRSALVYTEDPLYATLTDKNGYFKFRELPSGPITVRAEHRGFVPVDFQLQLPPDSTVGIGLKLLSAAPAIGTMQLDTSAAAASQGRLVRVLSDRGQPIMYANVGLEGAQARITDEKGEINLGTGARQKFSVRVSRIGFAPWFGVVDLPPGATMTVTLPQIAQLLAPVTVTADGSQKRISLPIAGFYDRWMMRQKGLVTGVFIGPEEMEFRHPSKVTRMLAGLNGIRLICDMSGDCSVQSTSPGGLLPGTACPLAVVLDGTQVYGQVNVDELINANDVMAIEVYARGGNVPISLQVNDTKCGVVAFWTGSRK